MIFIDFPLIFEISKNLENLEIFLTFPKMSKISEMYKAICIIFVLKVALDDGLPDRDHRPRVREGLGHS